MKRAPIVLTGTACGVVALVSYHAATPQASGLIASKGTLKVGGQSGSSSSSHSSGGRSSGAKSTATTKTTSSQSASSAGTSSTATRTAVGGDYQYPYGDLEVEVTMSGNKLVDVTIVKHDVTDPRSEQIDAYAVPVLRSQALQAQSASIDGVSGASYTSAAYEQSLQSALDKLKA